MTGTYSDAQTVEQGSHIHVMNITNQEADNGIFALLFTKSLIPSMVRICSIQ